MRYLLAMFGAVGLMAAAPPAAEARMMDPGLQAPALVETIACRTVRERVERPNGRVIYRIKRKCGPDFRRGRHFGRDCRVKRERVVRPNGSVIYRTVRRCR